MKNIEVSTYSMPTDYSDLNKELFIKQSHYKNSKRIVNYTFNEKTVCIDDYTTAIFIVRPNHCSMNNYMLTRLPDDEPVEDERDYNEEIEMMIQDKIDFEPFINDLYEREEGIS